MKSSVSIRRIISAIALLLFLLCITAACSPAQQEPAAPQPEVVSQPKAEPAPEQSAKEEAPAPAAATGFALGNKLEDFTVTLSDGAEVSLYGLLAEKKAVMLNFWATWCGPCQMEFPYLEQAYNEMSGEIGVLALSAWPADTDEDILALKKQLGLVNLPMGRDTAGLGDGFNIEAFPTTIMVDRNGIVCFREEGSIPDKDKFIRLFSAFTAEDYSQPVLLSEIPQALPTVEKPNADALKKALRLTGDANAAIPDDEAIWPFIPADGDSFIQATNGAAKDSSAALKIDVNAKAGEALSYEYAADTPAVYDKFTVSVDGAPVKGYGGKVDWTRDQVLFEADGAHTVTFSFYRSEKGDAQSMAMLRDMRVLSAAEAQAAKDSAPAAPAALSGSECVIQPQESSFKPFKLVMRLGGADYTEEYNLLRGDKLTFCVNIGEQLNRDMAFVGLNAEFTALNALVSDDKGYYYQVDELDSQNPFYMLGIIVADADGMFNDYNAAFQWFSSEAAVDSYVELLKGQIEAQGETNYELYWEYSDGSPKLGDNEQAAAAQSAQAEYVITVTDDQGKPVEGAVVQICDAETCKMAKTDANGSVIHTGARYPYEIHLLKAPEGFAKDAQTYTLPEEGGRLDIQLKRQ